MHKQAPQPYQPFELAREIVQAEWQTAQRIVSIQTAALRRIAELQVHATQGAGKSRVGADATPFAPFGAMALGALQTWLEASVISLESLADIQEELLKNTREVFPLLRSEVLGSVDQMSSTFASVVPKESLRKAA